MRPYPAYKDSGVEWLGEVPEGWEVVPLKRRFNVVLGKMLQPECRNPEDTEQPYLRAANIQWGRADLSDVKKMWMSPSEMASLALQSGDLLVSEGGDVGRSAIWQGELSECFIQNSVNRVRPIGEDSTKFLFFWMVAIKDRGYVDVLCNKSTIAHFTAEKLEAVPIPLPPLPEQQAIARFLDKEVAKIDALVAEQRRLIALLAEKRQAVISHAVTKGLNPATPLKPSGIDWLGDIPEGWEVVRLKHLKADAQNAFVDGPFGSNLKSEHYVDDGDVFVVESGFASQGNLSEGDLKTISIEHFETIKRSMACPGDIIIAKIGAYFGRCAILPELSKPAVISGNTLKLTVNQNRTEREFVYWFLTMAKNRGAIDDIVNSTAQPALSLGAMNDLPAIFPPKEEQREILKFLEMVTNNHDALTAAATSAISLLQERRAALISAAVTGKIDLRPHFAQSLSEPEIA